MQSDDACACFVRVGRCRLGSILGSMFESFWEPSSPLYSFLVALVAKTAQKRYLSLEVVFVWIFSAFTPSQKKGWRSQAAPSGDLVKPHFASKTMINTWENTHWAKVVLSRAVRRGGLLRGNVSQGSTSRLKPCVKG